MPFAPTQDDISTIADDPVRFTALYWPDVILYDKQEDIMFSVRDNDETIAVAGNQLGKDFITALIVLWFFCSRPVCHVVTSSSGQTQLKSVLWGEMRRFIQTARFPLPIMYNDMLIRKVNNGVVEPRSYIQGIVTDKAENLLGHHLERGLDGKPRTLAVFDEASSIANNFYDAVDTWAHRKLLIGNPLPCTNVFRSSVKEGSLTSDDGSRIYRKIIQIRATDSPNIQLAELQIAKGLKPTLEQIIPGVIDYPLYQKRRKLWDKIRQKVGLDAEFYEGAEVLLYPPDWLDRAERFALLDPIDRERAWPKEDEFGNPVKPLFKTLGVDPAEGGDNTVWTVIDQLRIHHMLSMKTTDTAFIADQTVSFINEFGIKPEDVLFDRGGGGKQHVDYLRRRGYRVRSVAFGEPSSNDLVKATRNVYIPPKQIVEEKEVKYTFKNRRAEMYALLRYNLLDPVNEIGFAIPAKYTELRRQLSPLPLLYDPEGRIYLPPKDKPTTESKVITIREILGCSPDESDSLVLAVFGQYSRKQIKMLGAAF